MTDQQRCWRSVVDVPGGEFELEVTQRLPMLVWDMGSQSEGVAILHQEVHIRTGIVRSRGGSIAASLLSLYIIESHEQQKKCTADRVLQHTETPPE
jgi:hypothetical protein